jgi:hypothetical protein
MHYPKAVRCQHQPPMAVWCLAVPRRHQAVSGRLWLPRAFRRPGFASYAVLCPLRGWPTLTMELLKDSRPQWGYHVLQRQDASGELASVHRELGTVSARPLTPADRRSIKDVSTPFVASLCYDALIMAS